MKSGDSPCKDVILKALTRLNDRSTLRHAAEELAIIVRALDQESLSALVQSICTTTGAWEPKPVAKKECVRVLAQLPLPSCPVADVALQQLLPKILGYLRKALQDTDSLVRDASSDAMAAYAQGYTRLYGCRVPGTTSSPVVKVVFDCLAEQKKEGQMGASQALLKMSPFLGPLDKDLVKTLIKLLKSPAFLGTAQLLAAAASTDAELRTPVGLLKHGASAFLPYLNHLIGQPSQRRASAHSSHDAVGPSSGGGSTAGSSISSAGKPCSASGILGCLSSQDWAVRRAAADAVRAVVLLVGPDLESEDCWGLGDAASVTGRCLSALEDCRFDKVKEAREAAREAAALIQQLHRFVAEQGPDGDWRTWASSNLPYSGWQSPAPSPPRSPLAGRSAGSFKQLQGLQSPIAKRFMRAATGDDVIVVPGDKSAMQLDGEAEEEDADEAAEPAGAERASEAEGAQVDAVSGAEVLVIQDEASSAGLAAAGSAVQEEQSLLDADMAAEPSGSSTASSTGHEDAAGIKQPSKHMQPRKLWGAHGSAPGSRPGSSQGSRPVSASTTAAASSRRTTGSSVLEAGGPLRRQSSHSAVVEPVPSYAAGTRSSSARGAAGSKAAAGTGRQPGCPPPGASRVKATPSRPQTAGAWQGPTQQEWEALQHQLVEQQQLVAVLQKQRASDIQELRQASTTAHAALQERIATLELQVQRQQLVMQEQQQIIQQQQQQQQQRPHTPRQVATPSSRRSPVRSSSSPSSAATMAAAAAIAVNSPVGGVLSRDSALQQAQSFTGCGLGGSSPPSSSRLYKSAEWSFPECSTGRKSLISPIDPVGHRSFNSLHLTPTSASGGLKCCDAGVATPGDLEAAYAGAVRGEKGGGVHLLRLCQKTGPVWGQLSTGTCRALLEVFIKHVRDGVMLHRVLPWLWRLADEDAGQPKRFEVPQALRQQLLEALECCPAAEDLQGQERVYLLLDTLKTVWAS